MIRFVAIRNSLTKNDKFICGRNHDKFTMTCRHYSSDLAPAIKRELVEIASKILKPGKGILAADESNDSFGKRLKVTDLPNTPENRRTYRQMLFTSDMCKIFL